MTNNPRPVRLSMDGAADLFAALGDLTDMPPLPDDAPCRRPGADPRDWQDPARVLVRTSPATPVTELGLQLTARALCAGCPGEQACRDWAIRNQEPVGVWGGTTPTERAHLIADTASRD